MMIVRMMQALILVHPCRGGWRRRYPLFHMTGPAGDSTASASATEGSAGQVQVLAVLLSLLLLLLLLWLPRGWFAHINMIRLFKLGNITVPVHRYTAQYAQYSTRYIRYTKYGTLDLTISPLKETPRLKKRDTKNQISTISLVIIP